MMRSYLICGSAALVLSACASSGDARLAGREPATYLPARRVAEWTAPIAAPPAAASLVIEQTSVASSSLASRRRARSAPAVRVDDANRAATREPSRQGYVNATQVYAWTEGALYRLYATPERVSDIALQPGETLVSVAAGDTARWVIGDTTSGSGQDRRTHILVKPSATGLKTNLVIATDRRVYLVELESTARSGMAGMSWTYPQDELLALSRGQQAADAAEPVAASISIEALNFGYEIKGDDPPWRPVRAFDDGRQVFIEFPPDLDTGEAPPLFVTGASGGVELVNYRLRGRYYVVDRLFSSAELRLGGRRQQVVRVVRNADRSRRRRGRS